MDTRGSLWAISLFDVADHIQLDTLRSLIGVQPAAREPRFKHPAPEYVRFERPPVEEFVEATRLDSGERLQARIKYFDYGVIVVELELPFEMPWESLILRSSQWIGAPEVEKLAATLAHQHAERVRAAFTDPYANWLSEDYYIIYLQSGPL